jgi:Transposase
MRLTAYGRNPTKRKESVHQPDRLLVGVDVSKAKHHACLGTQTTLSCRKLAFAHTREGFRRFAPTRKDHRVTNRGQRLLSALEPSGISWQALDERRNRWGSGVCLVHCQAVCNHRNTMQDGTRKTDEKAAYRVCDLLRPGQCLRPVARDPALQAASRMMRRHLARNNRVRQRRNPLRAAIPLAFPELHPRLKDLPPPTALRFLQANPTPESSLRNGRTRC